MAGSVQLSAGELNHKEKPHLAGSIMLGIAIGAVAGILVGGLLGVHESSSGTTQVASTSVSQQSAP
jgi:hypothetical protein